MFAFREPSVVVFSALAGLLLSVPIAVADAGSADFGTVLELNPNTLDDIAASGRVLLELHASWCGHCARFAPSYKQVAEMLGPSEIFVGRADGSVYRVLSQRFGVAGFPSFFYIEGGRVYEFIGSRSPESLAEFALSRGGSNGKEITGIAAPYSPYWRLVTKVLRIWDNAVVFLQSKNLSPLTISVVVAMIVIAMLVTFSAYLYFSTKPSSHSKQS